MEEKSCHNCKFMFRYQRIGKEEVLNLCSLVEEADPDCGVTYLEVSEFDATNCLAFMTKEI